MGIAGAAEEGGWSFAVISWGRGIAGEPCSRIPSHIFLSSPSMIPHTILASRLFPAVSKPLSLRNFSIKIVPNQVITKDRARLHVARWCNFGVRGSPLEKGPVSSDDMSE